MPRILVRAHKNPFMVASAEKTLSDNLIGQNTGNLVFSQAVYRLLSTTDNTLSTGGIGSGTVAEELSEKYDHVVVPLANAFRPKYVERLDTMSAIFEKLTIPVTVLGVGAQASLEGEQRNADLLEPAVRRFVRAVLRRSGSIGVRGEFTQQYLKSLGFGDSDVEVIGCPSMFMYGPDLKISKKVESLGPDSPIALNISPYVKEMGPISLRHAERYPNLVYMAQNLSSLELLLEGHYPMGKKSPMRTSGVPVTLEHPLIRQDRVRFFLDPSTWFEHLAQYDFSFGTRIHGNIAALLAGTPALLLAHDSRTLELAEYHHIPHRLISDLPRDVDAADLYAAADWEPLNEAHHDNWVRFSGFLARHQLTHVYQPGQSAEMFDATLAATEFPPPVRTLMGATPEELYAMKRELAEAHHSRKEALKAMTSRAVPQNVTDYVRLAARRMVRRVRR
ncbi:polysaccharide pyruvyl transferase family protein [Microlunatus panaciterrae]|uniref:Polysaccharide pyruvyl transferase domain-containing protein n=1 Tax=Microlunatus panaciterrae TaxID=400768 RepID=A0ABS2RFV6_9ACTN|nr:polysaccharide pyruvyl transferase family protein [Microlunatus panaciterrae]MBM7797876.1 hypothetical protein [Microlunatus panaciterrae]